MDLKMMKDPNRWPMWPVLPLKKWSAGGWVCGFLAEVRGVQPVVHLGYIYGLKSGDLESQLPERNQPYGSFEAIIADGWEVD